MKKILALLFIILILAGTFVSCSSDSGEVISKQKAAEEAKNEITEDNVEKAADNLLKELQSE